MKKRREVWSDAFFFLSLQSFRFDGWSGKKEEYLTKITQEKMAETFDKEELREEAADARRALNRKREELQERYEQLAGLLRVLEATEEVIDENEGLRTEIESLRAQLQDEKEMRTKAEMQLSEMSKLSAGVAKKASQDELLKALRVFVNKSKRKKMEKRIAVKEMVLELANANGVVLPEDLASSIDALDDVQVEPKVVTVQGNYNDVHDNGNVKLNVKEG